MRLIFAALGHHDTCIFPRRITGDTRRGDLRGPTDARTRMTQALPRRPSGERELYEQVHSRLSINEGGLGT